MLSAGLNEIFLMLGVNLVDVIYERAPSDVVPKCPFCDKRLEKVWIKKKGMAIMRQKQIIICPHCEAFLAFGAVIR
jgi:hypothetical protein